MNEAECEWVKTLIQCLREIVIEQALYMMAKMRE
jgi:hypothetical protein